MAALSLAVGLSQAVSLHGALVTGTWATGAAAAVAALAVLPGGRGSRSTRPLTLSEAAADAKALPSVLASVCVLYGLAAKKSSTKTAGKEPPASRLWLVLHGGLLLLCRPREAASKKTTGAELAEAIFSLVDAEVNQSASAVIVRKVPPGQAGTGFLLRIEFKSPDDAARWRGLFSAAANPVPPAEKEGEVVVVSVKPVLRQAPPPQQMEQEVWPRDESQWSVTPPRLESPRSVTPARPCPVARTFRSEREVLPNAALDDAEGAQRLLDAVHLDPAGGLGRQRWSGCDPVWRHPKSGAILYIGDDFTAKNAKSLGRRSITRIVNCQDSSSRDPFEGDPEFRGIGFDIGLWRRSPQVLDGGDGTWAFWQPLFAFVEESLENGRSVLLHCLAGAHRSGAACIGLLMYLCYWDWRTAAAAATKLRPVVELIGDFPVLLEALDQLMNAQAAGNHLQMPLQVEPTAFYPEMESPGPSPTRIHTATEHVERALEQYSRMPGARSDVISEVRRRLDNGRPFDALVELEKVGVPM